MDINRRTFLKGLFATGACSAIGEQLAAMAAPKSLGQGVSVATSDTFVKQVSSLDFHGVNLPNLCELGSTITDADYKKLVESLCPARRYQALFHTYDGEDKLLRGMVSVCHQAGGTYCCGYRACVRV